MKSTYLSQITDRINSVTQHCGPILLYGENIDNGSRIAGLARGLKVNPAGKILNVGNCELTHCGIGLGILLDGGNSVLFMKQLDFLLLGLDQVVNTYNFVRSCGPTTSGSFTIYPIICDQGYQGPQSSLNAASDVASVANVPVYCLNGTEDASCVIADQLVSPGMRVICTSQRLFGMPPLDAPLIQRSEDNAIFQYGSGDDVTLVCFNFALRQGFEIADRLRSAGLQADLFHVNFVPGMDSGMLLDSCSRTGRIAVLDDSKSVTKFGDKLIADIAQAGLNIKISHRTRRGGTSEDYGVCPDQFSAAQGEILAMAREK